LVAVKNAGGLSSPTYRICEVPPRWKEFHMPFDERTNAIDLKLDEKWKEISRLLTDASNPKSTMRNPEAKLKKQLSAVAKLRTARSRLLLPPKRRRDSNRSPAPNRHSDYAATIIEGQKPAAATIPGQSHIGAATVGVESGAAGRCKATLARRDFDSAHSFGVPRMRDTGMELPIFDRQSQLVGWLDAP
jgi:hypothetical protein